MARTSATSTTNYDLAGTVKAYAGLRVVGDSLVPELVTRILKIVPTRAHSKGERYSGGPRSPDLIGRTGVWYFNTDGIVAGNRLADHLEFLERLLHGPNGSTKPLQALQQLMRRHDLQVVVSCFWHGRSGAKRPFVPRAISVAFKAIPARIELDFDTDDEESDRHAA